jgi:hypothetical protein
MMLWCSVCELIGPDHWGVPKFNSLLAHFENLKIADETARFYCKARRGSPRPGARPGAHPGAGSRDYRILERHAGEERADKHFVALPGA